MRFFKILILILLSSSSFSQVSREWVRRFNGPDNRFDIACTMKLDNLSNIIVFGNSASIISQSDIVALKYSPSGNLLWQASFNGFGNSVDECKSVIVDSDGNSYITGFTSDTNQVIKIVTLKIDGSGNILWSKVFLPADYTQGIGVSIAKDSSGNIYSCGYTRRQNGSFSIAVIKYSSAGDLLGTALFNKTPTSSESPVSICADGAGNIYILGSSNAIGGAYDIMLLKYNSSLNLVWQNTFSGSAVGNDFPVEMLISKDNRLVVAAAVYNNPGGIDYGIYRYDTSGSLAMQYYYNGSGNDQDYPYAITTDTANNIFVTGSSRNADTLGSEDFFTMKIDPTAFLIWERRYNGSGMGLDYGASISVDRQGNVFVGGTTDKANFRQQYALLKYTSTGELKWIEEYSKIQLSEDFIYTTIADNSNNIYVTGISFDSTSDYDIATIKYNDLIGITPVSNEIPVNFKLYQNYPNPFNPVTKIKFDIPTSVISEKSDYSNSSKFKPIVKLVIYNVLGETIDVLVNGELQAGSYEVEFDGSNISSGIYYYKLENNAYRQTRKMVLIK